MRDAIEKALSVEEVEGARGYPRLLGLPGGQQTPLAFGQLGKGLHGGCHTGKYTVYWWLPSISSTAILGFIQLTGGFPVCPLIRAMTFRTRIAREDCGRRGWAVALRSISDGLRGHSTEDQGDVGVGLEAQRQAIEAACAGRGWTLVAVYQDIASGNVPHHTPRLLFDGQPTCSRRLPLLLPPDGIPSSLVDALSQRIADMGICRH